MAEIIDINIKSNASDVTKQTTGLRNEIKALKKELDNLDAGTEQYNQTFQELADKMHELRDRNEALKNSAGDLGTVFQNTQVLTTQVAAGFSTINAAMGLLGKESASTQKAMLKTQQAIALVQGLKGLEGLGKSTKAFTTSLKALVGGFRGAEGAAVGFKGALTGIKAAIAETGIGLLVIALGAAVTAMSAFIDKQNELKASRISDYYDKQISDLDEYAESLAHATRLHEIEGATARQVAQEKLDAANAVAIKADQEARDAREKLERMEQAWGYTKKDIEAQEKSVEKLEEEHAKRRKLVHIAQNQLDLEKKREEVAKQNAEKAAEEAAATAAKKAYEERLNFQKKLADESKKAAKSIEREFKKSFDEIRKDYRTLIKGNDTFTTIEKEYDTLNRGTELLIKSLGRKNEIVRNYNGIADKLYQDMLKKLEDTYDEECRGLKTSSEEYKLAVAKRTAGNNQLKKSYDETLDVIKNDTKGLDAVLNEVAETDPLKRVDRMNDDFKQAIEGLNALYEAGYITEIDYLDATLQANVDYNNRKISLLGELRERYKDEAELLAQIEVAAMKKPLDFAQSTVQTVLDSIERSIDRVDSEIEKKAGKIELDNINAQVNLVTNSGKNVSEFDRRRNELSVEEEYTKQMHELDMERTNNEIHEIEMRIAAVEAESEERKALEERQAAIYAEQELLQAEYNLACANFSEERKQIYDEEAEAAKTQKEQLKEYWIGAAADISSAIADLTSGISDIFGAAAEHFEILAEQMKDANGNYTKEGEEMLEKAKDIKEQMKQIEIATVIFQTMAGIASAWGTAMQMGFPVGIIVAAIETAALVATAAASIVGIQNERLSLSQESTGTSPANVAAIAQQSPQANENMLSNSNITDLQEGLGNTRVWVAESDIDEKQNAKKTVVKSSSF